MTHRIAMWSGPRNISTAMMRSWENRPDCTVVDEPFYACYLAETGIDHPMRAEVLASQSRDWQEVADMLSHGQCPTECFYQKHMTHHMLRGVDLKWCSRLTHCFLIRDPYEVVSSYIQKRVEVTADDIGIQRQAELYEEITAITGQDIPVIDAKLVLDHPDTVLKSLCDRIGVDFHDEMLAWPAGRRESDGVWASHWYEAVEQSTGFSVYRAKKNRLSISQQAVAEESMPAYQALLAHHL